VTVELLGVGRHILALSGFGGWGRHQGTRRPGANVLRSSHPTRRRQSCRRGGRSVAHRRRIDVDTIDRRRSMVAAGSASDLSDRDARPRMHTHTHTHTHTRAVCVVTAD